MRPCTDFAKLSEAATFRIRRLRAAVSEHATPSASRSELDRHVGRAVIDAQNTWSNFARSYLLSYLGSPRRKRGDRVALGNLAANNPGTLLHIATKACRGTTAAAPVDRRDEPSWHDTATFLRICNELAPTNLDDIRAALSMQTRVFADLPTFRNFYAHRNEESAAKAVGLAKRHYLISGVRHPTEALMKSASNRPQPLLLDWLDEMEVVVTCLGD